MGVGTRRGRIRATDGKRHKGVINFVPFVISSYQFACMMGGN